MATAPAPARAQFRRDLRSARASAASAVSRSRAQATAKVWHTIWLPFLADLGISDPLLRGVRDKVPFFRVLAERIRSGQLSRSGQPVRGAHVRDEIFHIAKTFTELGAPDPRLSHGIIDPRLTRLFASYTNDDPAPERVRPLPFQILRIAYDSLTRSRVQSTRDNCAINLALLGFFYLLRPGEYLQSTYNNPLRLRDACLLVGHRRLDLLNCPVTDLARATHSSLTFDTQKNRERGETIAHGTSGHPWACPTRTLARIVVYHRFYGHGSLDTPLCAYWTSNHLLRHVTSSHVTALLRIAAAAAPQLGIPPAQVNVRAIRSGGAMALLCARVDKHVIQLVGRWKSDTVFRYLHAQALPLITPLARQMLNSGAYTLVPGTDRHDLLHAAALAAVEELDPEALTETTH